MELCLLKNPVSKHIVEKTCVFQQVKLQKQAEKFLLVRRNYDLTKTIVSHPICNAPAGQILSDMSPWFCC
jgi:hypothetical protein